MGVTPSFRWTPPPTPAMVFTKDSGDYNVGSRLVWGSLIVRSFAVLIQHPQVRLGVLNCAKLRRQINKSEISRL